jgi:hypothetical protein
VVPAAKNVLPSVQRVVRPLGLRVDGVRGKLPLSHPIRSARVGLYRPWGEDTDEGWTRWLLEQYEFPFVSLSPDDVRGGNLRARFDAILLPSVPGESLTHGLAPQDVPAPYAGGLGSEGRQALETFVRAGGSLICLDQSCGFAVDLFELPITEVARAAGTGFAAPGTLVRLDVDQDDPLSYGLPAQTSGFFAASAAYDAGGARGVNIAVRYATKDLRVSGLLRGGETIQGRAAALTVHVGAGRVVLFGFRVQHRAQSFGTFRLLFNAILTSG